MRKRLEVRMADAVHGLRRQMRHQLRNNRRLLVGLFRGLEVGVSTLPHRGA